MLVMYVIALQWTHTASRRRHIRMQFGMLEFGMLEFGMLEFGMLA